MIKEPMTGNTGTHTAAGETVLILNVTEIAPPLKHATIFRHFDALASGAAFSIVNDHDPKPLYYELLEKRGNIFSWTYRQEGPEYWEVEIRKDIKMPTVGEMAAADLRKAGVFKKFGIDFCCGGKKSLEQACHELGLDVSAVQSQLDAVQDRDYSSDQNDYKRWQPDFLADYIFNQHHMYYYEEAPVIRELAQKVATKHGKQYPELYAINELFNELCQELDTHFMKEERVLFPFIKALAQARRSGKNEEVQSLHSIHNPVQMMEKDHEDAGDLLRKIRAAALDYKAPAQACNSFKLLFKKLEDFEADLHQHIHLENNILFPAALKMEREIRQ